MPAKGEYRRPKAPPPSPRPGPGQDRVGIREVVAPDGNGVAATSCLDVSVFQCRTLAAELADEWVEYVTAGEFSSATARSYSCAIRRFCRFVDANVQDPSQASLGRRSPDLHLAATEWVRGLPAGFAQGSGSPAKYAWALQALVAQRSRRSDRPVTPHLRAWSVGKIGLSKGSTDELDEFTRAEKKALIAAARRDLVAIEARVKAGWELARAGSDPHIGGFTDPANLLWAIAHKAMPWEQIWASIPSTPQWPEELWEVISADAVLRGQPRNAKSRVLRALLRRLFLDNMDLHTFRVLLMAATGHAPEEITALSDEDVEFTPDGVTLTLTKTRARSVKYRQFPDAQVLPEQEVTALHPGIGRMGAAGVLRRLMALVGPAVDHAGLASPFPLFLRMSLNDPHLTFRHFDGTAVPGADLHGWLRRTGVTITGAVDIRRLRKATKVEKAIAYKGRVSDIADDHSVEVFRGHYAHGTTLRVIAGEVITAAQQRWFARALSGPIVLGSAAAGVLDEQEAEAALGLTRGQIDALRQGQLDMGVTGCRDPWDSPFATRPGQLCPVAPLRCLECRHALVLPSNLPQLLLFSDHLERLRQRLAPPHFSALWGQSDVNLAAALAEHSDAEIAAAREQIAADAIALQLPLSAHVEFDR